MKPEDFNRLCAELVHPEGSYERQGGRDYLVICDENGDQGYPMPDFYHDANQRNKVIEKMEISVERDHVDEEWISYTRRGDGKIEFMQARIDRNESEIACIELVLEGK